MIDTGICEQHSVTLAAGLAMGGLRPVVAIYSTFLQRALDQIISDVALHDLPVTFLVDRSGVTGPDGPSHHGVFDLTFLRMVPNMVVGAPADAEELCAMIETALDHPGPIAIRFPKAGGSAIPSLPVPALPVGRWDEVRPGSDVLVLAVGRMLEPALKAAIGLESEGISCRVINARWVKPLDSRVVEWAGDHEFVLTVEDNVVSGGFRRRRARGALRSRHGGEGADARDRRRLPARRLRRRGTPHRRARRRGDHFSDHRAHARLIATPADPL